MRAFDEVGCEADWRKVAGHQGRWESKVNWAVLKEVDMTETDPGLEIPRVEKELRNRFKDKALVNKNLPASVATAPPVGIGVPP